MSSARNLMASKMVKRKKSAKRSSKSGFESFLEMNMQKNVVSGQQDLELERKLAKRLRIKRGKLGGEEDEFNLLFEGIPSVLDSLGEEGITEGDVFSVKSSLGDKCNKWTPSEQGLEDDTLVGDLNPVETDGEDFALGEATEEVRSRTKRRRKKKKTELLEQGHEGGMGAEAEVEGVEPVGTSAAAAEEIVSEAAPAKVTALEGSVKYVAPHLRSRAGNRLEEHQQIRRQVRGLLNKLSQANVEKTAGDISTIYLSVSRSVGSQIIIEEVLASCSAGPRGNEQYAAVFAAFVAGMACLVGIDFSAKLLASLAKSFEDEYAKKDDLSLRNLTLLFAYLYIFNVFASDLMSDFLITLSKQLLEIDVSTILTILKCCWMKLRRDDPTAMKDFSQSVQSRVNELEASGGGKSNTKKRMGFMLKEIDDIKNNKKRTKEETVQLTPMNKWLQKLHVEEILIRGLKWSKLLDPDKKGQWWLSGNMISPADNAEEVAAKIDTEVVEARKMQQLAAALGMNTVARKAIFYIIMGAEDYLDAFGKLLGLDLPGKQDREIMRVLLKCCLHEQVFNKYYTLLARKLCDHDRNHKFTLQYCLWDHFQELDSTNLRRSKHLADFIVEMLSSFTLSLSVLKAVDLSDPRQLTPNRTMHFRMLFDALFEKEGNIVWNVFTRIAVAPELGALRNGIQFFIREYVINTNTAAAEKFKVAKKALNNLEGVLM